MLSEEVIDKVVERLVLRIDKANEYILKEIGESIKKVGTIEPSKRNQLIQALKYGGDFDKIIKKLAKITNMNVNDIYKIFNEVAKSDYRFAKQFYDYRGMKYIPYKENQALQQQVRALASMTTDTYLNLTNTKALGFGWVDEKTGEVTYKGLQETYYDLLDEAVLSISQGKETFDSAMYRQLNNIGESGLKVIYESGRAVRLDSVVRMNIKSALTNLHNEMQKQIGEEIGADGVEISVHNNPAPDHEEAQGKQFSDDEWKKLQQDGVATSYDGKHIDMIRYNLFRPIGTMNCYHYPFSIILGVNKPQYSNKQLQEIRDKNNEGFELDGKHYTNYEGTQLQRKLETEIRKEKENLTLGKASNNQELIDKSNLKLKILNNKYNDLNKASGLPPKYERLRIADFKPKTIEKSSVSGIDNTKDDVLSTSIPGTSNDFSQEELFNMYVGDLSDKNVDVQSSIMNVDEKVRNRQLEQLNNLTDKYPLDRYRKSPLSVKCETLKNKDFVAQTWYKDKSISLNTKYYGDADKLLETEEGMIGRKWSYSVPKESYDIYTITHEYGHNVEYEYFRYMKQNAERNGRRFNFKQCDKDLRDTLIHRTLKTTGEKLNMTQFKDKYFSGYGKSKNNYEWFAEIFAQSQLGEKTAFTKTFLEWLEEFYD